MSRIRTKIDFTKMSVISILYAVFFTFCLYKNSMGITFPLFVAGTIGFFIYYMKETGGGILKSSYFYMAGICLLGLNVCLTTNDVVIVFDKAFIFLLFFMLFLHNFYDDTDWDVTKYVRSITDYVLSSFKFLNRPRKDFTKWLKTRKTINVREDGECLVVTKQTSPVLYCIIGLGISIPLLAIVMPLLMASDAIFKSTVQSVFSFDLGIDVWGVMFMTAAMFFVSYAMIYRFREVSLSIAQPVEDKRNYSPIIAITVNVVLGVVYLLYSVIQIVFLFMRNGWVPEGYTYTKYAHEGFFQLVFVCIINIVIVLVCRKYSKDSKALKMILCVISGCTYIMIASSAYRMYLYIDSYKLTFLRLYVLWALVVMAVIMGCMIAYLFKPDMPFARCVIGAIVGLWIIFIYARPDYQIASYNIQYHQDHDYIMYLSLDAAPAIEKYGSKKDLLEFFDKKDRYLVQTLDTHRPENINKMLNVRTWNFSLWNAGSIAEQYISD